MTKNGSTRDRILAAALEVFMEKGYEEASVRTILDKSAAVAGSFYHFFPSKEALFEAVMERYLASYAERVAAIANDAALTPTGRLDALLNEIARGTEAYFSSLHGNRLHWTVQYALHEKTICAILPSIQQMIESALAGGAVTSKLNVDAQTLAAVLLRGAESILHARPMEGMDQQQLASLRGSVKEYVGLLLELKAADTAG